MMYPQCFSLHYMHSEQAFMQWFQVLACSTTWADCHPTYYCIITQESCKKTDYQHLVFPQIQTKRDTWCARASIFRAQCVYIREQKGGCFRLCTLLMRHSGRALLLKGIKEQMWLATVVKATKQTLHTHTYYVLKSIYHIRSSSACTACPEEEYITKWCPHYYCKLLYLTWLVFWQVESHN